MINKNRFDLEKITNIVVIVAIVVVTVIVARKYLLDSNESNQKIEIGQKISLPAMEWKENKTVILATRKNCPFCTSSIAFFRLIVDEANKLGMRVEVVSSDTKEDSQSYLSEMNLSVQNLHQISLNKNGFFGTPTLLFVNQDGIVKDMWVGAVNSENLSTVLNKLITFGDSEPINNQLSGSGNLLPTKQITPEDVKTTMANSDDILIIDIDTREDFKKLHIANAKNIPNDEIFTRARKEIPKDKQIIFYGRCPRDSFSKSSQLQLESMGYSNVLFLASGLKGWQNSGLSVENNN